MKSTESEEIKHLRMNISHTNQWKMIRTSILHKNNILVYYKIIAHSFGEHKKVKTNTGKQSSELHLPDFRDFELLNVITAMTMKNC